ncbi:MAG: NAD(P)H-dependent oxidoreductase [Bdellovibrionota bacterium]
MKSTGVKLFAVFMVLIGFIAQSSAQVACNQAMRVKRAAKPSHDPNQPTIAVISGTDRADSNSLKVAKFLVQKLQSEGVNAVLVDVEKVNFTALKKTGYFNTPNSFKKNFENPIANADGLFIVFPEYDGTYAGALGHFLNYVRSPFASKPVGMVPISAGMLGGQKGAEAITTTLRHRGADVVGNAQVNIPHIDKALTDGQITNEQVLPFLDRAVKTLIAHAKPKYDNARQMNEYLDIIKGAGIQTEISLNSGASVAGKLAEVTRDKTGKPVYVRWAGATEIRVAGVTIPGQGHGQHASGFSSPIGKVKTSNGPVALTSIKTMEDMASLGLEVGKETKLVFDSGIEVTGTFMLAQFAGDTGNLLV